jgi:hypothetical protein
MPRPPTVSALGMRRSCMYGGQPRPGALRAPLKEGEKFPPSLGSDHIGSDIGSASAIASGDSQRRQRRLPVVATNVPTRPFSSK